MALKDWKKVQSMKGYHGMDKWIKDTHDKSVVIMYYPQDGYVMVGQINGRNRQTIWRKTKSQALKYAKAYMRKH